MEEEIDYNFVEHADSTLYSIRLMTGNWAGVIYTYGRVSIREDRRNDTAVLSFDYRIEDVGDTSFAPEDLETSDAFRNMIGDILADILSSEEIHIGKDATKFTDDNRKGTTP
jgi:hypothetical protein